jgi:hypothetical protein
MIKSAGKRHVGRPAGGILSTGRPALTRRASFGADLGGSVQLHEFRVQAYEVMRVKATT